MQFSILQIAKSLVLYRQEVRPMYQLNLKTETYFQKTKNLTPKGEKSNLSLTTQKVVSKLQKERLTKDVRYQEFNELTLDQESL